MDTNASLQADPLQTARARLDDERRRTLAMIADIESERRDNVDALTDGNTLGGSRQHLADIASETFERERELGALEDARAALAEIDDALRRVDDGTYGRCTACGAMIDLERLDALPAAPRCRPCQASAEREATADRRAADARPSNVVDHDDLLATGDDADVDEDVPGPEDQAMTIREV